MAAGTIYTYPENVRAYKALIAAKYSGANLKVLSQPPDFKFGETNKTEEFLKKFPLGKVPAFEGNDGVKLFESNAIAFYLANDTLRGNNAIDASYIRQWIDFGDSIAPASSTWVFPCMGIMQFNKQNTERSKEDVKQFLGVLNQHLQTRTYLVGERISLADISVCCMLLHLYQSVLDPQFRKAFENTNRWFVTLINQPQFKEVIGAFKMCEKMAQFDAKKWQEFQGPQKGGKKEKQEKKESPQKPKKEEKKKAPKEEECDEDDEPTEKPSRDPFAALPKGTFVMDDWKKCYSNNDTKTVALPYFWENIDQENYSVWYGEYKYPEELKMVFMSCNLVSGMFQRLDRMRKHAFGSMIVFGENNNSSISGVWVWRGHDLAFGLSPDLQVDYESYSWKKIEWKSDETKKLIEEYFSWEGDFNGKQVNQGKIFK